MQNTHILAAESVHPSGAASAAQASHATLDEVNEPARTLVLMRPCTLPPARM